jgi:hypothetical protein
MGYSFIPDDISQGPGNLSRVRVRYIVRWVGQSPDATYLIVILLAKSIERIHHQLGMKFFHQIIRKEQILDG